jgi:hypothetical protein
MSRHGGTEELQVWGHKESFAIQEVAKMYAAHYKTRPSLAITADTNTRKGHGWMLAVAAQLQQFQPQ